jgi:hypothetical protein
MNFGSLYEFLKIFKLNLRVNEKNPAQRAGITAHWPSNLGRPKAKVGPSIARLALACQAFGRGLAAWRLC